MYERTKLEKAIGLCNEVYSEMNDCIEFIEMGEMEDDQETITEAEMVIEVLASRAGELEFQTLLSGEADSNDCFLEINSGSGGTESQDWANMLFRMYSRWAKAHGYKTELLEEHVGDIAGIKSATLKNQR